jgi:putative DNA primase/helicase
MPLDKFLKRKFSVDKELLGQMIREKTVGMIAGPRGGGKTWVALLASYSIAGGKCLNPKEHDPGI